MADTAPEAGAEVAAVDLGSNSFHLLVARAAGSDIQVLDRLREPVRLAGGLDGDRRLTPDAQARALACLQRFGQRLRGVPKSRVRALGTNTLRKMRRSAEFIAAAEVALGHEIEVISGLEEARLVYAGVTHGMEREHPRRLVVDIGGGSTELIIGRDNEPRLMESVTLGCVIHTRRFFADGEITRRRFNTARLAARGELEFLERRYRKAGWDVAMGASGTVRGAWRVMRAKGWVEDEITRDGLEKTVDLLVETGQISKIAYPDLREDRRPVFAGGLAVLAGVFDGLGLERLHTSERALREGVVYDLLGRLADRDIRAQAVTALARRYGADLRHAAAVERAALRCLDQVADAWALDRGQGRTWLSWAATLHEIGLAISHAGYHKHSEYILRHADLLGFSRTEQKLLAALVRLHRGKFAADAFADLPRAWVETIRGLAVILRLAVLLHRSRMPDATPRYKLAAARRSLAIVFPRGWLARHPLTAADLELESDYLKAADFKLRFE